MCLSQSEHNDARAGSARSSPEGVRAGIDDENILLDSRASSAVPSEDRHSPASAVGYGVVKMRPPSVDSPGTSASEKGRRAREERGFNTRRSPSLVSRGKSSQQPPSDARCAVTENGARHEPSSPFHRHRIPFQAWL
jgi:hypothetical protein